MKIFKKSVIKILIRCTLFLIASANIFCLYSCNKRSSMDTGSISGTSCELNNENYNKNMYFYDGILFFYDYPSLFEVEKDGSLKEVLMTSSTFNFSFFLNNYFYYIDADKDSKTNNNIFESSKLCAYNLVTCEIEDILMEASIPDLLLFYEDSIILMNEYGRNSVTIKNDGFQTFIQAYDSFCKLSYKIGTLEVLVQYGVQDMTVTTVGKDGEINTVLVDEPSSILKVSDNILLICRISPHRIHCYIHPSRPLAWVLNSDGEIREIITPDGYVAYTGNFYNGYYYCSFLRYKNIDPLSWHKYANDKISGTWKINPESFKQTKISNDVFDDVFVIGDKVIGVDGDNRLCQ